MLSFLLADLWAATREYATLGDVRECIAEAELVGQDIDRDFAFVYDPLLVGVQSFDWAALAA